MRHLISISMLTRIFLKKIKAKKESNKLNTKDWALFSLMVLFIFAMGVVSGWLAFNCLGIGED